MKVKLLNREYCEGCPLLKIKETQRVRAYCMAKESKILVQRLTRRIARTGEIRLATPRKDCPLPVTLEEL